MGRCPVSQSHRREFLQEVGGGMLAVLVGPALAAALGLAAEDNKYDRSKPASGTPRPPPRPPELLQQPPTDRLLPALDERLKKGATLKQLIAAAAFANVRAFG